MGNRYTVHSVNSQPVKVTVKDADGEELQAEKQIILAELVPLGHPGGSIREILSPTGPLATLGVGDVIEHQGWKVVSKAAPAAVADLAVKE